MTLPCAAKACETFSYMKTNQKEKIQWNDLQPFFNY